MSAWLSSAASAGHRTAPRVTTQTTNFGDEVNPTPALVQLPAHFNPNRLAHVRLLAEAQQAARARAEAEKQARELESQARERELAELKALARAPAQPPTSVTEQWSDADRMHLFRLPGSMQSAAAYSTAPSFYKTKSPTNRPQRRTDRTPRSQEANRRRRQPHVQPSSSTRSRSPSLSSEYDDSTPSTPENNRHPSRPSTSDPTDQQVEEPVNSTPIHHNIAQGSNAPEIVDGIESINLPSLAVHSPMVTQMRALDDELEEIERQLRGEPARSHPHHPPSTYSSTNFLSPHSISSQHSGPRTPFTPPPISPVRPFLSTVDRNLIERYRREQHSAERGDDEYNGDASVAVMDLSEAVHSVLDGVDLHPHSILNDSLPSTIGEERSSEIQTREKEMAEAEEDATATNTGREEEKIAEDMFQKLPGATDEQQQKPVEAARSRDPLAGMTSSSLSDRLRLTDLQYPDMAPAWAHRSSLAATPWHHPLFHDAPYPGHEQRNAHPLQGKPLFESVKKLEKAALQKELQFRLSSSPLIDATPLLDKGYSSRAMLDPPSRLLENLWKAEEEFERMLHEDLPLTLSNDNNQKKNQLPSPASVADKIRTRTPLKSFANADQYRAYFDLDRATKVEYAPGNFIEPDGIVSHAYVKPVQDRPTETKSTSKRKPSKSPRASSTQHHHQHHPQPQQGETDIALELESILDPLASAGAVNGKHTFLGVSDWNGENDIGALLSTPVLESSTVAGTPQLPGQKVLVGVNDYELPGELLDVLDVDVDSTGGPSRLAKLHPARGFGHLVPLNNLAVAHALEQSRAQAEREKRMQGQLVEEEKHRQQFLLQQQQQLQTATSKTTARRGSVMPRSGSQSSLKSQQGKLRSRSMIASPTIAQQPERGRIARSPPPIPQFSHLHSAPDPVQLHRHVAARKIHESMAEMDEDLLRLEERALALAAEHQADQRELEAYQKRMAQRQNGFFDAKLTKAQQAWLETERNTRRAQDTLAQIEAVLAERAPQFQQQLQQVASPQASPRKSPKRSPRLSPKLSPKLSPSRRPFRTNVVHSPLMLPQSASAREQPPEMMQDLGGVQRQDVPMLEEAPTSRKQQQHRNVQHSPIGKPRTNPHGISPALVEATRAATQRTQQPSTIPRTVKKQIVKKKAAPAPMARLEHDLDNVLSQAQDLMNNFMANIK